jgi:hypothetical protein
LAATACGQIGTSTPAIINGEQFVHSVQLPSHFRAPDPANGAPPVIFDHYAFRMSSGSQDLLLVDACKSVNLSDICGLNSFVIDAQHEFRVREAGVGEWERSSPIKSVEMDDPLRRTLKQELAKPASQRAMAISPKQGEEFQAYRYQGNEYRRRGDWIGALTFGSSEDGSLVVLTGADKRKFPDQRPDYVAAAIYSLPYGLVTIDVFGFDASHHIASLDLDCHASVTVARRRISLVNSRWIAIGLSPFLDKMLLLDFKPTREQPK